MDEGHRQVVEVEQSAIWRFLWWSGTISVCVFVDQNRKDHTVKEVINPSYCSTEINPPSLFDGG